MRHYLVQYFNVLVEDTNIACSLIVPLTPNCKSHEAFNVRCGFGARDLGSLVCVEVGEQQLCVSFADDLVLDKDVVTLRNIFREFACVSFLTSESSIALIIGLNPYAHGMWS
jgi:hypothetical protein